MQLIKRPAACRYVCGSKVSAVCRSQFTPGCKGGNSMEEGARLSALKVLVGVKKIGLALAFY